MLRFLCLLLACGPLLAAVDLAQPIPQLTLADGRTLRQVHLISYASSAVMAKWEGGRGTLKYEQFPAEYQAALASMRPRPSTYVAAPPVQKNAALAAIKEIPPPPAMRLLHGQMFIETLGAGPYKFAGFNVRAYPSVALYPPLVDAPGLEPGTPSV